MTWHQGRPVTVVRPGEPTINDLGEEVPGTPTETTYPNVIVYPRGGDELLQARDIVIVGLAMLFPPGADVRPTDQLRFAGVLYDVDGEAGDWVSPFSGWFPGTQVAATRTRGAGSNG